MCGTQGYLAPELLRILPRRGCNQETFSHALDMWSLGCMVHELLTSQTPFHGDDIGVTELESGFSDCEPDFDMECMYQYCRGLKPFPTETLINCHVPAEGVEFVQRLLAASPDARPTAGAALLDPWLQDTGYTSEFCHVLKNECSDLGLGLQRMNDRSFIRQIRTRDIAHYLPASTHKGLTLLLQQALRKGHYSVAHLLMKSQIRISGDHDGTQLEAIFEQVLQDGEVNSMKILLSGERDVNTSFRDGRTVLQVAIQQGNIGMVQLLLDHGADVNNTPSLNATPSEENIPSPLQVAIETGRIDLVSLLVENMADVNSNANGRSMLYIAAFLGHIEIVMLLLVNMADVNARPRRQSALMGAINGAHTPVVKLLLDNGANVSSNSLSQMPLKTAILNGHFDIVKLLLDHGADVNTTIGGPAPLRLAVESGYKDIVELLLVGGSHVNDESNGRKVLQIAIDRRHTDIVSLLLDHDAHIHTTENSHTAFLAAVSSRSIDIVKLLLDRNPDVAAIMDDQTASQIEVEHRDNEIVKISPHLNAHIQMAAIMKTPFRGAVKGAYIDIVWPFISTTVMLTR